MPLDHTATGADIALHTYAASTQHHTDDGRSEDGIPTSPVVPHHPSSPALVQRMGAIPTPEQAKAAMTAKPHGNRFLDMFGLFNRRK